MKALAGRVKELRSHPNMTEEPPEYEPQSKGLAERKWQWWSGARCSAALVMVGAICSAPPQPVSCGAD